jgi:hypothetical protein
LKLTIWINGLNYAPPQKKEAHWKDYRSAKEMAKFWLNQDNRNDFQNFIRKSIPDFTFESIIPEFESKFDSFPSPRKHDLYIEEKDNKAIITIEGKADESFGNEKFGEYFIETIKRKIENGKSMALDRVVNLYHNYFNGNGIILNIMYQLSYWYAGSLIDAIKADTDNFVMVLQEFKSKETTSEKLSKNHDDFENFIEFISEGKFRRIENGQLIGPITNKYTSDKESYNKTLYIGYYSVDL